MWAGQINAPLQASCVSWQLGREIQRIEAFASGPRVAIAEPEI